MTRKAELSTAHLTVLGLLEEGPTHGFALVKLLAPDGAVGRVWSLRPTLVYRALSVVAERGLAEVVGSQSSGLGPRRTVYALSADGRKRLWRWLLTPVGHVREVRVELLLKLALLDRLGEDPHPLLRAQRAHFAPLVEAIRDRERDASRGFDHLLSLWRAESVEATVRFIDRALREPDIPGPT